MESSIIYAFFLVKVNKYGDTWDEWKIASLDLLKEFHCAASSRWSWISACFELSSSLHKHSKLEPGFLCFGLLKYCLKKNILMLLLCKCIYLGQLYEWMMVLYHDCTQFVKFKLQGKGTLFSTIERLWCSRISIYENKRYLHVELGWGEQA